MPLYEVESRGQAVSKEEGGSVKAAKPGLVNAMAPDFTPPCSAQTRSTELGGTLRWFVEPRHQKDPLAQQPQAVLVLVLVLAHLTPGSDDIPRIIFYLLL